MNWSIWESSAYITKKYMDLKDMFAVYVKSGGLNKPYIAVSACLTAALSVGPDWINTTN